MPSGPREQIWNIDLTQIYARPSAGRVELPNGKIEFVIDDQPVPELELTMSFGYGFADLVQGAATEENRDLIGKTLAQDIAQSTLTIWERRRLSAVLELQIDSEQIQELKAYVRQVPDRVTLAEELVPSDLHKNRVAAALKAMPLEAAFQASERFLERAWIDPRFFNRFREFDITLNELLVIERSMREDDEYTDWKDDDEPPHTAIVMALNAGGLCTHFNEALYARSIKVTEESVAQATQRDRIGARNKYLAALGTIFVGLEISTHTQLSVAGLAGVGAALLWMSGLSQSSRAKYGRGTDREIVKVFGHLAELTHAQGYSQSISPESVIASASPLAERMRNKHKIIECGAVIDALSLFGLSYKQIAAHIPASRYDGMTSSSQNLRELLWKQCQSWGITTFPQFRSVYRALHARRKLETRIEKSSFANLAADVLLDG